MQTTITGVTWSNNWMSGIEDNTPLSEISIPGTHDSCALHDGPGRKQCQWFTIIQQLNRGVRFLDIRNRYKADSESGRSQNIYFPIHHGTIFQNIYFEEVQAQCIAFLSANPTETILMNVQMEYDCHRDEGGCGTQFRTKFLELIEPYRADWWCMGSSIPKLGDCRGRIVLIRAYSGPPEGSGWPSATGANLGLEWNGFSVDGTSSNKLFATQNGWNAWSGTKKGDKVEEYLRLAPANAKKGLITLNWASYASDLGPGPNAKGMNERLQRYLKTVSWGLLGVVVFDFTGNTGDAGDSVENLVIEHQVHQKAGWSYFGFPDWLIKQSR